MTELILSEVSLVREGARLLDGISLTLRPGVLTVIIGPNGAGKTSLMRCAAGVCEPTSGDALLDGQPIADMAPATRARMIAHLPQLRPIAWPLSVEAVVALGRYAYGAAPSRLRGGDRDAVDSAIAACGLEGFQSRKMNTLSGGEQARAHCARAFATRAPLLLADEPTGALDPAGRLAIMALIRAHVDQGAGACVILHDIQLAAQFADRLVWIKDGALVADGPPKETLSEDRLKHVFSVASRVTQTDEGVDVSFLKAARSSLSDRLAARRG